MTLNEKTIDLDDGLNALDDDIDHVEDAQDELLDVIDDEYDGYHAVPAEVERKWEALEDQKQSIEGQQNALQRVIDEWDGAEFVIQELSGGQLVAIQDEVNSAAAADGMDMDGLDGARVVAMLQKSIVQAPPGAPDNPRDYPWAVMLYLFEKVNAFNTTGDTDFQSTSLRDAMP
jgi:hypothetical protein